MKRFLLLLLLPVIMFANIGKITAIKGSVKIERDSKIIVPKLGTILNKHDFISTSKNGKLQIVFIDNTIFTIGKNSTLDIADYLYDEKQPSKNKTQFNVLKGAFSSITGRIGKLNKSKFKLKTRSAAIGLRGTIVKANQQVIMCTHGAISVTTPNGKTVDVKAGQKTDVSSGTPTIPEAIKKGDIEAINNIENGTSTNSIPDDITNNEAKNKIKDNTEQKSQDDSSIAEQKSQDDSSIATTTSWGSWASDLSTLNGAEKTNIDTLDKLRNSTSTTNASYSGQVSGTTNTGGNIKVDAANAVKVNFALGGGQNTMNGTIKFNTILNQAWDTAFSGTTSGNNFSSTSISGNVDKSNAVTSGNIDGSFYGSNSEAVGGTFDINANDGKTATGNFKATK